MISYVFKASERIKSKKSIEKIFSGGRVIISDNKTIKAIYLISSIKEKPGVTIAVAVSKKLGTAVWRNKVKRLLRESYRLNKQKLIDTCIYKSIGLMIIFSPNDMNQRNKEQLKLKDFVPGMIEILNKLCSV